MKKTQTLKWGFLEYVNIKLQIKTYLSISNVPSCYIRLKWRCDTKNNLTFSVLSLDTHIYDVQSSFVPRVNDTDH